ncbi:UPF0415 protein C7orf25 homolog isoform X2 [Tribolium castaneum]|nr:PREDICTED: UPF0415 protein C7orf25 homolog [Tribolium castaneum]|eukprot:XP_966365.1 PREDICTED: UPF0415 protein C7orf25 homolog [Tribolium castaneum]
MGSENVELCQLVLEKLAFGENLIKTIDKHRDLDGVQKLKRKIRQELNFLSQVLKTGKIKKEHVQCSNLTHFSAVIETLNQVEKCLSVNKTVMLDDRKITIDLICDDGLTWMKVIARNAKSLSQICMGNASFGVRSVLDQAQDYLDCAKVNPCLFQIPRVVFVFVNGVERDLATKIENLGIIVNNLKLSNISLINKVNLDVSAMLAYVSSVCNGSANLYDFSVHVLAQQAEWERQRPQKPILDDFFAGKKLYCCETARDSFISIVNTVGGPNERKRADDLLQKITVLPDLATADNNVQLIPEKRLTVGGKIKERSLTIFTFGDRIGAVTVTSNDGFVRAAKQQGINFVVFIHESRALTEQKELTRAIGKRS